MKSQTLKAAVFMVITLSLMILVTCGKRVDGEPEINVPLAGEKDWPCDTCMAALKLVDVITGQTVVEKSFGIMKGENWPPDTTKWRLKDLPIGKYRLELHTQDVERGKIMEGKLKIWYFSSKYPSGFVGAVESVELVNVADKKLTVNFRDKKSPR